jgi:hypothetical protein
MTAAQTREVVRLEKVETAATKVLDWLFLSHCRDVNPAPTTRDRCILTLAKALGKNEVVHAVRHVGTAKIQSLESIGD